MRLFLKLSLFIAAGVFITACDKEGNLPYYGTGTAPKLSTSTMAVAPAPADSDNIVLSVNWNSPNYSTDSTTIKYIVQIDSAGRGFANAVSKTVTGIDTVSFTAKELNNIALGFGFAFNTAYSMDIRLISSYANNNDQKTSNIVTIKYTPYKIPPKVALPASGELYLVGSATQGAWNNPVPVPAQKFAQIDETTWSGVFQLNGNSEYLVLPVNGDWSHKYAVADKTVAGLNEEGDFGYDLGDNFPGPINAGLYIITLNFQTGRFTVTPYTGGVLPDSLYIVGDATPNVWDNPVPVPSQQFTRLNSAQFELTINLTGGKQYLFLPKNGDWGHKFAIDDPSSVTKLGGTFMYDAPSNIPGPDDSGTYKIDVNFIDNTYKLTKQ
jgi:hypothetical protein